MVRIEGEIVSGTGGGVSLQGSASDRQIIAELEAADGDAGIAAVLLYINSPGGSVVASDEIYRAVTRMSKPVVAYFGEMAASGGYYVACGADLIVAHPASVTGSIGVISTVVLAEDLLDKLGVDIQVIKSADAKDMGSLSRPLTDEERGYLQAIVDEAYQGFVDVVVEGRGLSREAVLAVADGRVVSGAEAMRLGLADSVGDMRDGTRAAAELAGIRGEPRVVEMGQAPSLLQLLLSSTANINPVEQVRSLAGPGLQYRYLP